MDAEDLACKLDDLLGAAEGSVALRTPDGRAVYGLPANHPAVTGAAALDAAITKMRAVGEPVAHRLYPPHVVPGDWLRVTISATAAHSSRLVEIERVADELRVEGETLAEAVYAAARGTDLEDRVLGDLRAIALAAAVQPPCTIEQLRDAPVDLASSTVAPWWKRYAPEEAIEIAVAYAGTPAEVAITQYVQIKVANYALYALPPGAMIRRRSAPSPHVVALCIPSIGDAQRIPVRKRGVIFTGHIGPVSIAAPRRTRRDRQSDVGWARRRTGVSFH